MKHVDEILLEEDSQQRYSFLAEFIGFGPEDVKLIQGSARFLGPRIGELVDSTYEKLMAYDATARHFLPKQHGFEGEPPADLAELTASHPQRPLESLLHLVDRSLLRFKNGAVSRDGRKDAHRQGR